VTNVLSDSAPVLVSGATGKQGGAVARALLKRGIPVRALVRDPASPGAKALTELGATLQVADLYDPASLLPAMDGVRAVFSVQTPDPAHERSERLHGRNLVAAAVRAGVPQFVHSSVSGAGEYHRAAPGWAEGRWNVEYWEAKEFTADLVRTAGFSHWTIVQPTFFMENFLRPSLFFVNWTESTLRMVLHADTVQPLVAVEDIGTAVAAIVAEVGRFDGMDIRLAGDYLSMRDVAATLSEAWGEEIPAPSMSVADVLGSPLPGLPEEVTRGLINMQEWMNEVGDPARPRDCASLGIRTTTLAEWARAVAART